MTTTLTQKAQCVALSLLIFSATLLTAQTHGTEGHSCGTAPMTAEQVRYTLDVVAKKVMRRNAGMTCIPLQAHIVRETGGTGGIDYETLNKGLANANYYFQSSGIEFFWANLPNYADDTDYYDYNTIAPDSDTEANLIALFAPVNNAINVYFVNSVKAGATTGYAYFPTDNNRYNMMVMDRKAHGNALASTFIHEMGHFFNLSHTFSGTENGSGHVNAENVPRDGINANCSTKGDLLCDTEADPKYNSAQFNKPTCTYTGGGTDINGVAYLPPVTNVMSYYPSECSNNTFTPNQITRVQQALVTRQGYVNCTMNALPMIVTNPSGLAASQSALSVVLNWADNANNEMGYLIERSTTSDNSGFKPVPFGGTANNITTFTDNNIVANTTYYYRIKAANDGCNDYSNVVTFTPQPAYCNSAYTTACALDAGNTPRFLSKFTLKTSANATLFNNENNGCSGALSDFTANAALSANVTVGTTYNFDVRFAQNPVGNWYYAQDVGVWLDVNNDKDFDDAGENLGIFLHPENGGGVTISGSFTIPANTPNGAKRLRIRSAEKGKGMAIATVCSNFGYGESEDYTLNVSGSVALSVNLLRFQGKNTEGANFLNWQTATEVNAAYFEVERSLNGQNFDKIATTKAFGKANTYDLNDKITTQTTHYYRLKMVDNDGSFSYSKIISLHGDKRNNNLLSIYPNPVIQFLTIQTTEESDVQIVNFLGQTVLRSKATQQLDVSALPTGTYFLKIGGQQARFVKQ